MRDIYILSTKLTSLVCAGNRVKDQEDPQLVALLDVAISLLPVCGSRLRVAPIHSIGLLLLALLLPLLLSLLLPLLLSLLAPLLSICVAAICAGAATIVVVASSCIIAVVCGDLAIAISIHGLHVLDGVL